MPTLPFHYIITIHNKENLLGDVLAGLARCASPGATILPVLDGCTDGSAKIVQAFTPPAGVILRPVVTPDVHEIQAINAGLRECGPGFVVVLQDDVILRAPDLERRLVQLRDEHQQRLGLISLRMGGQLVTESWPSWIAQVLRTRGRRRTRTLDVINLIGSCFDSHPVTKTRTLAEGTFAAAAAVYKSPVVFTPELRAAEPYLDEALAPYGYDDLDMSIRALRHGLTNGVVALNYASEVEWGGTRSSEDFATHSGRILMRNRSYVWHKHRDFLRGSGRHWLGYR